MDFLEHTVSQNPAVIRTAVDLHQEGKIPHNTVVIDLDKVRDNVDAIADTANRRGLELYGMTKQFGRNPLVASVIADAGIGFVAVDIEGAKSLHRHGLPVEHVGHLCQVPSNEIEYVVREIDPEVITVFSHEKAAETADAAAAIGETQDILLRVVGEGDFFYDFQRGGFHERAIAEDAAEIDSLDGVRVAGLTSFPTVRFNIREEHEETLPNFDTLLRASEAVEAELGRELSQINAPGDTSAAVIDLLADKGATHGEPGHGFFGTTPWHFFNESLPEDPAWTYVSEVSHVEGNRAYTYGGNLSAADPSYGFWTDLYQQARLYALVGDGPDVVDEEFMLAHEGGYIDYNVPVELGRNQSAEVGDTVVYGFRNQVFVSRANVAVIDGIQNGEPELLGLFDRTGNLITYHQEPRLTSETRELMDTL